MNLNTSMAFEEMEELNVGEFLAKLSQEIPRMLENEVFDSTLHKICRDEATEEEINEWAKSLRVADIEDVVNKMKESYKWGQTLASKLPDMTQQIEEMEGGRNNLSAEEQNQVYEKIETIQMQLQQMMSDINKLKILLGPKVEIETRNQDVPENYSMYL